MKTIDIKGKPYIPVNERLKYFRTSEEFSRYKLETTIISADSDMCLIRAEIRDMDGYIVSTGHAYEESASSFINKTSHVENCETSAIGRALGNLGIGIDESVASFEEVANAISNQSDDRPWLNDKTFKEAIRKMNEMSDKNKRKEAYTLLDSGYKMKKEYRKQLLEIVEEQDIRL